MPRWWKEFWNRSLKCKRLGHTEVSTKRVIRRKSSGYRTVAEDFWQTRYRCRRCGIETKKPTEKYRTWWSSVSMPGHMWDEISEKGYCVIRR